MTPTLPPVALIAAEAVADESGVARIDVAFETGGNHVGGVQVDLLYDSGVITLDGPSSCRLDPALGLRVPECEADPVTLPCKDWLGDVANCGASPNATGCTGEPAAISRFRGMIVGYSFPNTTPIPDASPLFTCDFRVVDPSRLPTAIRVRRTIAGSPSGDRIPTRTGDGSVTGQLARVGGRILGATVITPLAGVEVQILDSTGASTAITDANGFFESLVVVPDAVQILPLGLHTMPAGISAYDASLALVAAAEGGGLDRFEELACDVTANGSVTLADVRQILDYRVGKRSSFPVVAACNSAWGFDPVPEPVANQSVYPLITGGGSCFPGGIILAPAVGPALDQDFVAVGFGDCSGSWWRAPAP